MKMYMLWNVRRRYGNPFIWGILAGAVTTFYVLSWLMQYLLKIQHQTQEAVMEPDERGKEDINKEHATQNLENTVD